MTKTECPHGKGATCPECNFDGYPPARGAVVRCKHGVGSPWTCAQCLAEAKPLGMVGLKTHCPIHQKMMDIAGIEEVVIGKPVTGSDNPHYDFDRPVSCLRELVEVLDPNMDWKRYNMLKSAIRWDGKNNLRYTLEKIIYHAELALLQVQKDEDRG